MLQLTAMTNAIGAEVGGIDLQKPVTDELYQAVRLALVEHEVLFFRDQIIEPVHQKRLAACFGKLQTHPVYNTLEGFPEISILESTPEKPTKIELWHSDMTFRAHPPMATLLLARVVPAQGGDTLWASMTAAYNALSSAIKTLLEPLQAVHDFRHGFKESLAEPGGETHLQSAVAANPPVRHPVIQTHPESNRKLIFVNELFTTHILGLTPRESRFLLDFLFEHIRTPEFSCRFQWRVNSAALWDNRSTQHKPVNDYFSAHRRMERIAIDGDKPF